jgi:hypothetical protein
MYKYFIRSMFLALLALPLAVSAEEERDLSFIDGIWQFIGFEHLEPKENSDRFFSLHYDGNALVLVNFEYIKHFDNPLAATFIGQGKTREFLLEPLDSAPDLLFPSINIKHNLRVNFTSDTEADVTAIFDSPVITGATYKIRKIFK